MRHIVYEIILDFAIALGSEDNNYREDKRYQKYQCKDYTRYHETDTREYIVIHIRKMYLHNTHYRLGIISELHL